MIIIFSYSTIQATKKYSKSNVLVRGWRKRCEPGSNILMLDHYRGLWLAGWWWRHILLLRKLLSKLTPGKLFILKNLPDQETPGVTSHGLGRVGVGLPFCLCLSFPQISATT